MGLFLRMLQKQKWGTIDFNEVGYERVPADAITADLRTQFNELSVWFLKNRDELNKGVLAIALGRNQITRLDVIVFEEQELLQMDLNFIHSPKNGKTPLLGFSENHYDLINIDYEKLGKLSQLIVKDLSNNSKCIRFEKGQINEILYAGYKEKLFSFDELPEGLQSDLIKVIKRKESAN